MRTIQKQRLLALVVALSIALLLIFPQSCLDAAKNALELWLYSLVPSLLPFFVLAQLLMKLAGFRAKSQSGLFSRITGLPPQSALVYLSSTVSGHPTGPLLISGLIKRGELTQEQAIRTLPFVSCASPMFVVGTVCTAMLGAPWLSLPMAVCHYLSAPLVGILCKLYYDRNPPVTLKATVPIKEEAQATTGGLFTAIEQGVFTMLRIGGTMVFFSVLIAQANELRLIPALSSLLSLLGLNQSAMEAVLSGSLEMGLGVQQVSALTLGTQEAGMYALIVITFGGLCVAAQCLQAIDGCGIPKRYYFLPKLVQTAIAAVLFAAIAPLAAKTAPFGAQLVFSPIGESAAGGLLSLIVIAFIINLLALIIYILLLMITVDKRSRRR